LTKLRGPERFAFVSNDFAHSIPTKMICLVRQSWLIGQMKALWGDPEARDVLEQWASEFGSVFYRPGPLGNGDVVVIDPKAAAHVVISSEVRHTDDCIAKPRRTFLS
jgi:hypothetical protein